MTEPLEFEVTGMDCAACALTIERGVAALPGVEQSNLAFTTGRLRVAGDVAPEAVLARVEQLGYRAAVRDPGAPPATGANAPSYTGARGLFRFLLSRRETRLALLGALLVLPGLLFDELLPLVGVQVDSPLFALTSVAALAVAGWPIARSAWRSLLVGRQVTINLLMTIAAVGAVVIGAYTEAALVMVLFAVGEALEGYSAERARASIRSLMEIAPDEATVLRPCMDCREHRGTDGYEGGPCPLCGLEEQRVPVAELAVGERVVVRPGEHIPVDGRVLEGASQVNQAPITGESVPVAKSPGGEVFAGSINGEGALEVEVTRLAADSTVSRIIRLVEEAQERRAPVQSFVDRFARVYTPAVVVIAALVAVLPPALWGAPFWGDQGWLYRALEMLVVACPCALVISTPVSLVSAITAGAHSGVLFKGGAYLQLLDDVAAIAFDKTGTLTAGAPRVVAVRSVDCAAPNDLGAICAPCNDLVALAHAVERRSEHPLARAVTAHAGDLGVAERYPAASDVTAVTGRGVVGRVNGHDVFVGSHAWLDQSVPHDAAACAALDAASAAGQTPLALSVDDAYAGYIAVADAVRPSSRDVVAELKALGVPRLVMLTGDAPAAAQAVAAAAGVTEVRARLLPEDKVAAVEELKREGSGTGGAVVMVGDGINDAPALAAADVGVAIGAGGSAQAMETADVVLMAGDLSKLPFALRLSRAAMRTIRTNVALSIGIKLIVFALVLLGLASMWLAVLADVGTSLIVTAWGLRLLRFRG